MEVPEEKEWTLHEVIAGIYGTYKMDGMPIWWSDGLIDVLGKISSKISFIHSSYSSCNGEREEN